MRDQTDIWHDSDLDAETPQPADSRIGAPQIDVADATAKLRKNDRTRSFWDLPQEKAREQIFKTHKKIQRDTKHCASDKLHEVKRL